MITTYRFTHALSRRRLLALAPLVVLGCRRAALEPAAASVTTIDGIDPLRTRFDRYTDRIRVLAIGSPT